VSRQRSVLLSRGALEEARQRSDLYQETIAYRMQALHPERFPKNAPIKLVNRAFNGHRVLLSNALMIAEVLDQPLQALLDPIESAADAVPSAHPPTEPAPAQHAGDAVTASPAAAAQSFHSWVQPWVAALIAACVVVVSLFWFTRTDSARTVDTAAPAALPSRSVAAGGALRTVLVTGPAVPDWIGRLIADELDRQLRDPMVFTVALPGSAEVVNLPDRVRELGADLLLRLDVESVDRHVLLVFTVASQTLTERFWMESAPASELDEYAGVLVGNVVSALNRQLGLADDGSNARPSGTRERQSIAGYLRARELMEASAGSSGPVLDRAFRAVQSAIEHDDEFALAWAAKCEVLARLYWVDDTQPYLDEAAMACDDASRRLPGHPYVISARARVATRTGDAAAAMAMLEPALAAAPTSIVLNMAAAEARYMDYYWNSDATALGDAMEYLRAVTELEPGYWEAHFWLGTFSLSSGEREQALAALREAARLNPNELALSNLGTVTLCQGDLDTAASTYQNIIELTPGSALANEMLGTVHHFRGEYGEEIVLRERSLAARSSSEATQIHGVYGGLADAYRLSGQPDRAIEAYRTAIEVLQRDEVNGTFGPSEHASAAYYAARLAQLADTLDSAAARTEIRRRLDAAVAGELDILPTVHAAQALALLGDSAAARDFWARASARCPVYLQHPERPAGG
jgi:tetratricopeptide (TPR) repeat protein